MAFIKFFEKTINFMSSSALYLLIAGAIFLLITIYRSYGIEGLSEAIRKDMRISAQNFIPIVVIFIVIMGSISFHARKNPGRVHNIISGKEGQIKMLFYSMIMPGPAGAPELCKAWKNGEKPGQVILCLTAMMGLGITMFIFRGKFLGGELTLIWFCLASALVGEVWVIGLIADWIKVWLR
jgi:hypothetical protein